MRYCHCPMSPSRAKPRFIESKLTSDIIESTESKHRDSGNVCTRSGAKWQFTCHKRYQVCEANLH
ncbi:hypothetical protein [uncultured Helicobacter sp.]|uniref:hypothetical protein n=1 Tax=uncultured Helicobacter sp. TaxID=175537 RepID=UPI003751A347